MSDQRLEVRCACGWRTVGTEDEVIVATTQHGTDLHNMQVTRDEVLAMSRPADDVPPTPPAN